MEWALVYIAEAHGRDEWPISSARHNGGRGVVDVRQSRTLLQRRQAASRLARDFAGTLRPCEAGGGRLDIFIDDPERGETFEKHFAPWPLRFFVLQDGCVSFIASPAMLF